MQIQFFCTKWGQEALPWPAFLASVQAAGYDGIETSVPTDPAGRDQVLGGLARHSLALIGQHWETVTPDFAQHRAEFEQRLRAQAAHRPLLINSQTGKDYYTFAQNQDLLRLAQAVAAETGVPIVHETHRGKFSFAAHVARPYLEQLPDLRLALDISHWCAVAETLLADQPEAVALALARTDHVHARVGHAQGAQVSDPRAPEWAAALAFHLACWDEVVAQRRRAGCARLTITPEFGPPPYLPTLPFTQMPVADQWELNGYLLDTLKRRYAE